MGLRGDGSVAHRAGLEAAHDRRDRLHFVQRDRAQRGPQLHQPAQRREALRPVVDEARVVLERRVVAGPDGALEQVDRERVEEVRLALGPVLVLTADAQLVLHRRPAGRVGAVLAGADLVCHALDPDPPDPRRRPAEVLVDEVAVEPERLEDLGPVVALDGGDPHPGDRLDDPLQERLPVALLGGVGGSLDHAQAHLVVDRLEGEVGVDRAGAVAHQEAEVVGLARLAGFEHQAHLGARPGPHEVVVDRGHGQERRDRGVLLVVPAVGQDDQVVALRDRLRRTVAHVLDRLPEPLAVVGAAKEDRQRDRPEAARGRPTVELADLLQLQVGEHRRRERQLVGRPRSRLQEIVLRADGRLRGHDDLLADRVHGRVRDLREELLEVPVQELGLVGEDGERRVVPHGAHRVRAGGRHRVDDQAHVLGVVAEDLLAAQHGRVVRLDDAGRVGKLPDPGQPLPDPRPVGLGRRGGVLELAVGDDPTLGGVHQEHVAGPDAALRHDLRGRDVEDARLGRHDGPSVGRDRVARRAQPVAIQRRAHAHTVGEGDRCRAVPRLHQAGVVLVEGPQLRRHGLVAAPRLGHQHHHRVRQRAAGQVEQLQDVVQDGGVGALGIHRREHLLEVVPEQ